MLEKRVLTILELNWNKIEHLSSYAQVVHTTAKQVMSRRRKCQSRLQNVKTGKMRVQKYFFPLSNMQICGVFVAVVVVVA